MGVVMAAFKDEKPCRICRGEQATRCIICGWQRAKSKKRFFRAAPAITEEEKARRRKLDFLGGLYNQMRKLRMQSTGQVGNYGGRDCFVTDVPENRALVSLIFMDGSRELAMRADVVDAVNVVDERVLDEIGDPLAVGAEEYVPFYKPKRTEVG